ncbi:uncharacterized protein DS421_14g470570 [Arachis hypogaea]|nr:uncharacterized protein DS421_14g470570 [Arachis hypogaea]
MIFRAFQRYIAIHIWHEIEAQVKGIFKAQKLSIALTKVKPARFEERTKGSKVALRFLTSLSATMHKEMGLARDKNWKAQKAIERCVQITNGVLQLKPSSKPGTKSVSATFAHLTERSTGVWLQPNSNQHILTHLNQATPDPFIQG